MMKVLPNELENQPEFDGFTEWLQTFELYRGKQGVEEFEDEGRVVGKFKVSLFLKLMFCNLIHMHTALILYFWVQGMFKQKC